MVDAGRLLIRRGAAAGHFDIVAEEPFERCCRSGWRILTASQSMPKRSSLAIRSSLTSMNSICFPLPTGEEARNGLHAVLGDPDLDVAVGALRWRGVQGSELLLPDGRGCPRGRRQTRGGGLFTLWMICSDSLISSS